jgi:hypothetical protein
MTLSLYIPTTWSTIFNAFWSQLHLKPMNYKLLYSSDILNNELFNKELDKKQLFCRPKPRI